MELEAMENLQISDENEVNFAEEDEVVLPRLSEDVMLKIFDILDVDDLRNNLEVREHREMIMSSAELMRKLPLCLVLEQWKYKVHFMINYGPLIKRIKAIQCHFDTIQNFASKLALCPDVEEIDIDGLDIVYPMLGVQSAESARHVSGRIRVPRELLDIPLIEPKDIQFKRLKRLSLNSSNHIEEFLNFFENVKHLESLELTFMYKNRNQNFTKFLTSQKQLESLELLGNGELMLKALFLEDISQQIKFKLKKLTIDCELTFDLNFAQFLRNQKQLLELNFTGIGNHLNYHEIVFNELPNLKRLAWPVDKYLDNDNLRYIQQYKNTNVLYLRLHGYNLDPVYFRKIVSIFPNIIVLSLEYLIKFNVKVLESFKSLRHLYVQNYRAETTMFVKFKQLEILEVQNLVNLFGLDYIWEDFMANNSKLKTLIINQVSNYQTTDPIEREIEIILHSLKKATCLTFCRIQRFPPLLPPKEKGPPYPDYWMRIYKIYADHTNNLFISHYIKDNCPKIMELLLEIFPERKISYC